LEDWSAFVQRLSNIFGSYSPEDDDEDAIVSIPFPHDRKATDYFICFAKYQNRICWENRSLRKVVKGAIPARISEELHYSREDLSSFEGYKRAVLRINNNFWRQIQDEKNKARIARTLQHHLPKPPRTENAHFTPDSRPPPPERAPPGRPREDTQLVSSAILENPPSSSNILGPDGRLTIEERTCRMNLGLCLRCSQSGHLARLCPKQAGRGTGPMGA